MLRFLILIAVSTEEQAQVEAPSLPAQRATLEAFAAQLANGTPYTVVDVLEIAGFSRYYTNWDLFCAAASAAGHDAPRRMEHHWQQRDFDVLLALDISRIGRREGIVVDFVSRTIDAGASINLKHGGEINASNYGAMMMINAYSTAQERRMLRERSLIGMKGRYERGLHHAKPPMSHIEVMDTNGKHTGEYILDPRFIPIWRDAATLLLEGVAWDRLEAQLHERYGHINPVTGKPFPRLGLHRVILSTPMFWGHVARHFTRMGRSQKHRANVVSPYLWDASLPVPEGVQLQRDAVPAVWTGSLADQIKAELKRRSDLQGRAFAGHTYMFSGLCVCDECGYSMSTSPVKHGNGERISYMRCMNSQRQKKCGNSLTVRYDVIQMWMNEFIAALLEKRTTDGWVALEQDNAPQRIQLLITTLRTEATQIEGQITKLINELSMLPDSVSGRVRQEIERLSQRARIIENEIVTIETQSQRTQQSLADTNRALNDIASQTLERFWQQESRIIHQTLHQLLGEYRLYLRGKSILGLKHHF
jgi:hypothetical protein